MANQHVRTTGEIPRPLKTLPSHACILPDAVEAADQDPSMYCLHELSGDNQVRQNIRKTIQ